MATFDTKYNSLEGQLLVSTPATSGNSIFFKSIVYIISHTEEGAFGIIVNQPITKIDSSVIFSNYNIDIEKDKNYITIYLGGPVEAAKGFILHSADYNKGTLFNVNQTIAISSNVQILKDIANGEGPKKNIFALGYSSWQKGQLESELLNNSWLTIPYSEDLIFSSKNQNKWVEAYNHLGINHTFYSIFSGNA